MTKLDTTTKVSFFKKFVFPFPLFVYLFAVQLTWPHAAVVALRFVSSGSIAHRFRLKEAAAAVLALHSPSEPVHFGRLLNCLVAIKSVVTLHAR